MIVEQQYMDDCMVFSIPYVNCFFQSGTWTTLHIIFPLLLLGTGTFISHYLFFFLLRWKFQNGNLFKIWSIKGVVSADDSLISIFNFPSIFWSLYLQVAESSTFTQDTAAKDCSGNCTNVSLYTSLLFYKIVHLMNLWSIFVLISYFCSSLKIWDWRRVSHVRSLSQFHITPKPKL
jgi:hypothetical protein